MKKVLIQTLGVGRFDENRKPIGYAKTKYEIDGQLCGPTLYIADPLLQTFQPDILVLIGTVKTDWYGFYHTYSDGMDEAAEEKLYSIQEENGKDTTIEKLALLQKEINTIFEEGLSQGPFSRKIDIHIILTRYGMNQDELEENYEQLFQLDKILQNDEFEVAFDITHSFRSLPIYDLVILNYLKAVSDDKIRISHVYYGNLDVKRENNDVATIVDLEELIKVLELTTAVEEFKHTGNAMTLVELLPEGELRKALQKFDWATQTNNYTKINETLIKLLQVTKENAEGSKYADAAEMIEQVVSERLVGSRNGQKPLECYRSYTDAKKRIQITKWFQGQNRYGLAVATAYEAMKSVLVDVYIEKCLKKTPTDSLRENETNRRNAIERLYELSAFYDTLLQSKNSEIVRALKKAEELRREIVDIRNRFAHNLKDHDTEVDVEERKCIDDFINIMEQIAVLIQEHHEQFLEIYGDKSPKSKKGNNASENLVILTCVDLEDARHEQQLTRWKEKYNVFCVDVKEWERLNRAESINKKAAFIVRMLRHMQLNPEKTKIYLHHMNRSNVYGSGEELVEKTLLREIIASAGYEMICNCTEEFMECGGLKKNGLFLDQSRYGELDLSEIEAVNSMEFVEL